MSYEELEGIPKPSYESLRSIWNSWSQDPIKATILQAVFADSTCTLFLGAALCQRGVCSSPLRNGNSLLKCFQDMDGWTKISLNNMTSLDNLWHLSQYREIWSSPTIDTQEEGTSSSSYAPSPEGHATVGPGGA